MADVSHDSAHGDSGYLDIGGGRILRFHRHPPAGCSVGSAYTRRSSDNVFNRGTETEDTDP